jgi:hypothetical protein
MNPNELNEQEQILISLAAELGLFELTTPLEDSRNNSSSGFRNPCEEKTFAQLT